MTKNKIVVFDIDGTLANIDHRIQRLEENSPPHWDPQFDWKKFFHLCEEDEPIEWTVQLARTLKNDLGMTLTIFTGRSELVRDETEKWLRACGIPYDHLIMRPQDDYRLDEELKPDLLESFRESVAFIIEDRSRIAHALREQGYNVLQCATCDF